VLVKVDLKWSELLQYNESSLSFRCSENSGVYSISASVDQKLQVVYVGKADNIGQRLRNHRRFFEPNSFLKNMLEERECYFRYCEVSDLMDRQNVEYTLFKYYHPICNIVEPKGKIIDVNIV
jgi:excinuclease UvrABC nuclease subunit